MSVETNTSNKRLTKQQLLDLDERLEQGIPKDLLSGIPRNVAVMNLLRYYEDQFRLYNPQLLQGEVVGLRELIKQGQDSIHFAMWWIHRYCKNDASLSAIRRTDDAVYFLMKEIMDFALAYSGAWDYMGLLWRGSHSASFKDDNSVEISYFDKITEEFEIADQLLNAPYPPNLLDSPRPDLDIRAFLDEARPRRRGKGQVEYSFPNQQFEKIRAHFDKDSEPLWEMPPAWDIGGYTFAELRQFWTALTAWCSVHQLACYYSGVEGVGVDSLIERRPERQWIDELTMRSGLPFAKVKQIVTDLTYAPELYDRPKKPNPNVLQQPFFRVARDELALGNQLVLGSNADRNTWSLIGIIRQPIQDRLKNKKEDYWLEELRRKLSGRNIDVFGPFEFSVDGEPSDLDALIYDSASNSAMVTQLKWHVAPDRINEIAHTAEELNDGIRQALLAMKWIAKNPEELAARIKIDVQRLKTCQMRPLVLSKNMMGKGRATNDAVPICSERLFDWIILDPHQKSLEILWQVLVKRRFLPKLGKHYSEEDADFEFNGVKLIGKNMGLKLIGPWNPKDDIDFEGL